MIDVPAMGWSNDIRTVGYFKYGETPSFKLLKHSTGKIISLIGNIPAWSANNIYVISELHEIKSLPKEIVLEEAYSNPFNPSTTLYFSIPEDAFVFLEIYNLQGSLIEALISETLLAGYHSIVWNANEHASGIYFIQMKVDNQIV